MRRHLRAATATAGVLGVVAWLVIASTANTGPPGKSGTAESITLDLEVVDYPGTPAARIAERFARQVTRLSGGSLRVSIGYPAARRTSPPQTGADIEASVIRAVRANRVQLALVPSWAFESVGVRSLAPLQAPFQLMTLMQAERVAGSPVADVLQEGLGAVGLAGVGLLPEAPERVFGFLKPIATPSDFGGLSVRVPPSATTFGLLRRLDARPLDLDRSRGDTAVFSDFRDDTVAANASNTFPANAVTVGNAALFTKVDVVVVSGTQFARLGSSQRDVLRRAAAATRAEDAATGDEEREAAEFCRNGGTVVTAPGSAIAALRAKSAPILTGMRDAEGASVIAAIAQLGASPGPALAACGPAESVQIASPPSRHYSFVDLARLYPPTGTYRRFFTVGQLRAAGASEFDARRNDGVVSLTVYGVPWQRRFAFEWGQATHPSCRGRLEPGTPPFVVLRWNPATPCSGYVAIEWRRAQHSDLGVVRLDPHTGPAWLAKAYSGTWYRVDCSRVCGAREKMTAADTEVIVKRANPSQHVACHKLRNFDWDYECYFYRRADGSAVYVRRWGVDVDSDSIVRSSGPLPLPTR